MSHRLSVMSSGSFSSLVGLDVERMASLSEWFARTYKGLPDVIVTTDAVGSALAGEVQSAAPGFPFSGFLAGVRVVTAPEGRYAYILAVQEARKGNNVLLVTG